MIQHCEQMIERLSFQAREIPDQRSGQFRQLWKDINRWERLWTRLYWSDSVPRKPMRRFIDGQWHDEDMA